MVRLSGPGTWDPTAISHSLLLTYTSESSQQIFFIPVLNDTPMLDGEPLESFQVALNTTINDTGSGQTLRNQLGGLLAATTGSFQLNVDEGVALNGTITSVTITDLSAVPEPSTFLTSALGLGSLLWPRRRKQSR
jgi:hypothetical protein